MATIFIAMHPFVYSTGLHQTGIRGIQDTRQFIKKIKTKKVGPDFHKTTHEKSNLTPIKKPSTSSVKHPLIHGHNI